MRTAALRLALERGPDNLRVGDIAEEPASPLDLVERSGKIDRTSARVLAASVAAGTRVALQEWLGSIGTPSSSGLVIPTGSLPELLRAAPAARTSLDSHPRSLPSTVVPAVN